jgi:hypothetical protein
MPAHPPFRSPRAILATQPTADKAANRDVMVFGGIVISLIRPRFLALSRVLARQGPSQHP